MALYLLLPRAIWPCTCFYPGLYGLVPAFTQGYMALYLLLPRGAPGSSSMVGSSNRKTRSQFPTRYYQLFLFKVTPEKLKTFLVDRGVGTLRTWRTVGTHILRVSGHGHTGSIGMLSRGKEMYGYRP